MPLSLGRHSPTPFSQRHPPIRPFQKSSWRRLPTPLPSSGYLHDHSRRLHLLPLLPLSFAACDKWGYERQMPYVYLMVAILAEVIATTSLKSSNGFSHPAATALAVTGYLIAFYFLSLTLRDVDTGIAYAIWSGIGTVLITLVAWVAHGQKLDASAIAGIILIISGVIIMNLFSGAPG